MRVALFFFGLVSCVAAPALGQVVETITPVINASGGVSVGPDGNVYVADFGVALNNPNGTTIHRVTPEGEVSVFATGLVGASGNAFDAGGHLFQSNIAANRISKITPDGTVGTFVTAGMSAPVGVAIDDQGTVFVANCFNSTIRQVSASGVSTPFAADALLQCPNGLTLDDAGNLYTSNFNNGNVLKITPDGVVSRHATVPGGGNGHLTFANGRLYVASFRGNRIYEVSLSGAVTLLAGTGASGRADGPATEASFFRPNGIAASVTGDTLYVNDTDTVTGDPNRIRPNVVRRIILSMSTRAADAESLSGFVLGPSYPNPFRFTTHFFFDLPRPGPATLKVFDVLGREVDTLIDGMRPAGRHTVTFRAGALPGGVYVYRLETDAGVRTRTMLLLK